MTQSTSTFKTFPEFSKLTMKDKEKYGRLQRCTRLSYSHHEAASDLHPPFIKTKKGEAAANEPMSR